MPIAQVKVTQYGIVNETLEDDVLVASGAGVVDAPETIGSTGSRNGIGTDDFRIFLDGFCQKFIVFSFAGCVVLVGKVARAKYNYEATKKGNTEAKRFDACTTKEMKSMRTGKGAGIDLSIPQILESWVPDKILTHLAV